MLTYNRIVGLTWSGTTGAHRRYFMFRVLPFGLSTACYAFTKLLRPLVRYWRSQGKRAVIYIADGICAASNALDATRNSQAIQNDLIKAGLF